MGTLWPLGLADPGNEIVEYRFLFDLDARGHGPEYTLRDLAQMLGVHAGRESKKRNVGWRALWTTRFQDFQKLREIRGGFKEGHRSRAAHVLARILQSLGTGVRTLERAVMAFAAECIPPMRDAEVRSILKHVERYPLRKFTDRKIAVWLEVTTEEGIILPRWAESKIIAEADPMDASLSNNRRVEYRQGVIRDIVGQLGYMPSYRVLASLMEGKGIEVSHVQVRTYCQRMELHKPQPQPELLLKS